MSKLVRQPGRQVVELRVPAPGPGPALPGGGVATHGDDLLHAAHRQALGDDALGQPFHGRAVVEAEQGAGVARH